MPSGITHMILSLAVLDDVAKLKNHKINDILNRERGAYVMGSVAPDLPYMPVPPLTTELADKIHKSETNQIPLVGLKAAKELVKQGNIEEAEALFAFYAGYCSHLTADGVIHPFIRDMVGDYEVAKTEHRTLEVKLDVLIADKYFNDDCCTIDVQYQLDTVKDSKYERAIYKSFASTIHEVYPEFEISYVKVHSWVKLMRVLFDVVAGSFPVFYKDIISEKGFALEEIEKIRSERNQLILLGKPKPHKGKDLPFNHMNKPLVNLFEDVIPIFEKAFPIVLASIYEHVFEDSPAPLDTVLAIDLDTGRLIGSDSFNAGPAYAKLAKG